VISVSAVGSMRESIRPREAVAVDQFIDRTTNRPQTFFGDGVAAHVSLADPVCPELRASAVSAGTTVDASVHDGGTYVCIEGPAFSTRAESELFRSWGVDVIGMTNMQEVRLAREAELCYATLAMVTDYDCWHDDEDDVSVASVLDNLRANSVTAAGLIRAVVAGIPERGSGCECADALKYAIITDRAEIAEHAKERLDVIAGKYLRASGRRPS
jgi:5'-methylthioadenosine phosphorylase